MARGGGSWQAGPCFGPCPAAPREAVTYLGVPRCPPGAAEPSPASITSALQRETRWGAGLFRGGCGDGVWRGRLHDWLRFRRRDPPAFGFDRHRDRRWRRRRSRCGNRRGPRAFGFGRFGGGDRRLHGAGRIEAAQEALARQSAARVVPPAIVTAARLRMIFRQKRAFAGPGWRPYGRQPKKAGGDANAKADHRSSPICCGPSRTR